MGELSPQTVRQFWLGIFMLAGGCIMLFIYKFQFPFWVLTLGFFGLSAILLGITIRQVVKGMEGPLDESSKKELMEEKLLALENLFTRGVIKEDELERRRARLVAEALGRPMPKEEQPTVLQQHGETVVPAMAETAPSKVLAQLDPAKDADADSEDSDADSAGEAARS